MLPGSLLPNLLLDGALKFHEYYEHKILDPLLPGPIMIGRISLGLGQCIVDFFDRNTNYFPFPQMYDPGCGGEGARSSGLHSRLHLSLTHHSASLLRSEQDQEEEKEQEQEQG